MTGMELLRQYRNIVITLLIRRNEDCKKTLELVFPLQFLRFALATDTGVSKLTVTL
jgi:hypothetical protein